MRQCGAGTCGRGNKARQVIGACLQSFWFTFNNSVRCLSIICEPFSHFSHNHVMHHAMVCCFMLQPVNVCYIRMCNSSLRLFT